MKKVFEGSYSHFTDLVREISVSITEVTPWERQFSVDWEWNMKAVILLVILLRFFYSPSPVERKKKIKVSYDYDSLHSNESPYGIVIFFTVTGFEIDETMSKNENKLMIKGIVLLNFTYNSSF